MAVTVWPPMSATAHLAGRGPAVIQVGLLSWFVVLVTWLHEVLEDIDEWDSVSEVLEFLRIPQSGPLNGGLNAELNGGLKGTIQGHVPEKSI